MESTANCKTPCPVSRQVSASDWDNLWRASLEPHPNQAPTWYQTWKSTFGVTDDTLLSVHANDKPALIAPLRIESQTNTAHFLYTDDLIDRNDFIYADSDQLKPGLEQLIHYLRSEHGVRNLALSSLVDTSPTPPLYSANWPPKTAGSAPLRQPKSHPGYTSPPTGTNTSPRYPKRTATNSVASCAASPTAAP